SISLTGDDDQKLGQGIINGLRYYEELRDEAEDKRLFYVAITRAKYRAVLLADHRDGSPGKKKSWWWTKHIEHAFALPELTNLSETEPVTPGLPASEIKILPKDDILKGLEKDSSNQKMPLEWTDPPSYDEPDEFFDYSVHDLMDHIFPESKPDGQENGERSGTAIEVGEIFHIIMENEWWRSGNEAEIENYIKNSYHYLEYEPLIEKIRRHTENLQESEFLKSMKKSEEKYYELPVTGWFRIVNKLFQISGKIDLIYRIGSKWYVVDYKTSGSQKDRRRHELQVQIYLMIIKQLYNIEAEGKIYYSDMNKLESVGEESELTVQKFMPDDKLVVRNKDRSDFICIEKILAGKYPGSTIIINPTKHNSLEVLKTLSAKRLIDPSIRITTLDNYIRSHNFSGTQNTTELRRLLTQKTLDDNEAPRGKIDLLSKAFQKAESGDVELHRDIEPVYEEYIKIKTEKSILSDPDIINKIRADIHFGDKRVILNKLHKTSREYFDLFRTISDKADQFYFIDNFNDDKISTKLKYNPSIWETSSPVTDMSSGQLYSKCHTIADEVENCAVMIRNIPRWEERTGQLKIAVSSMEKYVPLIKKIFDWYGIPVTVAKNEPVLERPAAQLLLRFIDLLENSAYPDWNTVANIILHPLFDHEEEYFELDLWARTNGIRFFRDIPGAVKNSIPDEKKRKDITEVYQKIETELSKYALESAADLIRIRDMIFSFFADIDLKRQLNISRLSKGIYEKLNTVLENILRNHHTAGIPGGLKVFKQELLQSLEEAEIPTKEQDYGIEVLGFMDTLHIDPDRLYILGLTEDEFPVKPLFNPYVENSTDYNWRLGLNLYRHWKSLGDSVHFFTSTRNNDDEPLQPSTFTEFLKQSDHTERSNRDVLSPRDHYLLYSGRLIPEPADDKNFISRHNAYFAKSVNEFRGKTEKAENSEFIFSPTSLDILLSCPMRYWFKKVLNIEPSEFDETSKNQLNKGRALHTALDNFGKKAGFEILKSDLNKACSILDEELRQALALNDFNTEEDLITYYMLISYLRGLKDKNPDNVLIQLFEWNLDKFGNFDHAEFEKWIESPKAITGSHSILNDGDLLVKFKGKVDKLLIDNNTNTVTASDYKTGSVNMKDITGLWTSQFLVYYLVLKDNYPDHRVRLVYEQIKNFSNSGLKCFSGDLDAEENRNGVLFDDDFIKDSKKVIMDFCRKVLRGEFSITERFNRGRPCNICSYSGLCRKDS
ncbi:MAG: Dna2/Cas4 domain-containing protein, partial [bacterium]|nr:Dna2/Cas4 domain-containing protein [bacterium]